MEMVLGDFSRTQNRFEADKYLFNKRSKSLVLHFKKWKTAKRGKYTEHFSPNNWQKLTEHEKRHAVHNARPVMFIISPSNLYFPCGVINQTLLQIKIFTKKSTVESLKNHLLET